jgi:hypothetical protein
VAVLTKASIHLEIARKSRVSRPGAIQGKTASALQTRGSPPHPALWQGGSTVVRWVSAVIQEVDTKFRRVQEYRVIEKLTKALEGIEAEDDAATKRVP